MNWRQVWGELYTQDLNGFYLRFIHQWRVRSDISYVEFDERDIKMLGNYIVDFYRLILSKIKYGNEINISYNFYW